MNGQRNWNIVRVLEGMKSKSESRSQLEPDPNVIPAYSSEPWWRSIGCSTIPTTAAGRNASNLSSECPNSSESNDDQSRSSKVNEEDDDATKDSHATASSHSARNYGEKQLPNHAALRMTTMLDGCPTEPPQLELVGHSIACATNLYQDPFYGGMMAVYGHQPLGYPHLFGMHHARMPLPHEMAQEPVYVNAKQYHGILRRREARAKAEVEKKLIKARKPYLHESRHQHALRRARSSGGRFAKKSDVLQASEQSIAANANDSVHSAASRSSSDSAETGNSSIGQRDNRGHHLHSSFQAHDYVSGGLYYQNCSGMQTSKYNSQSGEIGEGGDHSG